MTETLASPQLESLEKTGRPSVAVVGSFAETWGTETYILRAFQRLGLTTTFVREAFHTWRQAATACKGSDLVLFNKARFYDGDFPGHVPTDFINACRAQGSVVVAWLFDQFNKDWCKVRNKWALDTAEACVLFFTTDGFFATETPHPKLVVLRQGCPDDWTTGGLRDDWIHDFVFIGTVYRNRCDFVGEMKRLYRKRFQLLDGIRGPDLSHLCRSAKLLVAPPYPVQPGYFSNRVYVVTGNRGCFLGPEVAGMREEGWKPGENYFSYDYTKPLEDQVKLFNWYAHDEAWRERVAANGAALCRDKFTYDARCRRLLEILDERKLLR
jgi:hypothetical protein